MPRFAISNCAVRRRGTFLIPIHGWLGIDNDMIWDILRNEIALLLEALDKLETAANRP